MCITGDWHEYCCNVCNYRCGGLFVGFYQHSHYCIQILYQIRCAPKRQRQCRHDNMLRNYGAKPAIITCAGDFLKGVLAILFARGVIYAMFGPDVFDPAYIAGICVILGHIYPIYFGFRGGKGMVTTASVLLMINPLMFGIIMVIFLIIVLISKIVSLGSILCAIIYPFLTFGVLTLQGKPAWLECIFSACLAVLLVFMHRANIKRLLNGTENKFGSKKKKEEAHHG